METMERELETHEESEERRMAYMAKARSAFRQIKEWINERERDGWNHVDYKPCRAITLQEKQDPDHEEVYLLKARGVVRSAITHAELRNQNDDVATRLARMLCDYNPISRKQWDAKDIEDIRLLSELYPLKPHHPKEPHLAVIWTLVKTPPAIWDRDFVTLQFAWGKPSKEHPQYNDWWVVHTHTSHPDRPPLDDPVRGRMITGSHIVNTKHGAEITTVAWVDPGGWVSPKMAAAYKEKLADRIAFYDDLFVNGKLGGLYYDTSPPSFIKRP